MRSIRPVRHVGAQRGFTLIELLVASTLLAILAVIGWRGLDAVLNARDRIVQRSDDLRAMAVAFSQLDEDLRRSWPVRLMHSPALPLRYLRFSESNGAFVLELLREGGGALDASRIERVAYRVRDGLLERGFGPLLVPTSEQAGASPGGALPVSNAPLVWQPLLRDVAGVAWRGFVRERGWGDPATITAAQAVQFGQTLQAAAAGQVGGAAVPGAAAVPGTAPVPPAGGTPIPGAGSGPGGPIGPGGVPGSQQLEVTGVEVTVVRSNGDRYLRVFPVVD